MHTSRAIHDYGIWILNFILFIIYSIGQNIKGHTHQTGFHLAFQFQFQSHKFNFNFTYWITIGMKIRNKKIIISCIGFIYTLYFTVCESHNNVLLACHKNENTCIYWRIHEIYSLKLDLVDILFNQWYYLAITSLSCGASLIHLSSIRATISFDKLITYQEKKTNKRKPYRKRRRKRKT